MRTGSGRLQEARSLLPHHGAYPDIRRHSHTLQRQRHPHRHVRTSSTPLLLGADDLHSGISRAYGGSLSALEILVTLSPQFDFAGESLRDKPSSWTQNEEVSALYLDKRGREKLSSRERVVELPAQ